MFLNPYHRAYAVVQMDEEHQQTHSRHTLETVYQGPPSTLSTQRKASSCTV
jgi:hypothetical protein